MKRTLTNNDGVTITVSKIRPEQSIQFLRGDCLYDFNNKVVLFPAGFFETDDLVCEEMTLAR